MENATNSGSHRYGLVLSGGGIRFAVHAGVVAEMARWRDQGQPWLDKFEVLVGTSAGALYSSFLAVGYTPEHVARLAPIFADLQLKQSLFDWNYDKAAAAFLRHNISYILGVTSGRGVLTLVETLLSKGMPEKLMSLYPNPLEDDPKAKAAVIKELKTAWDERRARKRDRDYFADLLTFADCRKELYLIGVNAFTGQKNVFCKLPKNGADLDTLDKNLFDASTLNYINLRTWQTELDELTKRLNLPTPLRYPRFENRVYHQFDTELFAGSDASGPQLPVALAVRSSVSLPIFFEPTRIQRKYVVPGSKPPRHEEDLFLDGGVDDNFSLSVASDPFLGNCTDILGISLGNWGYRFPDRNTTKNIGMVLLNTTNYLGQAIQDMQVRHDRLVTRRITVINSLPSIGAQLTDTEKIESLVNEARGIAEEFWKEAQEETEYPASGPVETAQEKIFVAAPGIRVYVSKTARIGTPDFEAMKNGEQYLGPPNLADVISRLPSIVAGAFTDVEARGWLIFYGVLVFLLFGVVTFVSDLLQLVTGVFWNGWAWLVVRLIVVIALLLGLRLLAFVAWERVNRKEPVEA